MTIPPQNLYGMTAEELYDDRLVSETRVFDPTLGPPSPEEDRAEYEVATLWGKAGARARNWERHNNLGKNQRSLSGAWQRLQEQLETQRQLETTLEEATVETTTSTGVTRERVVPRPRYSVEATADGKHQVMDAGVAGDPVVVRQFDTETGATALFRELQHGPRPKTVGPTAREEPQVAAHEFEQAAEQPLGEATVEEAARATAGKMDDAYGPWMTFGDEALDEITAAVLRRPEIKGGLIGGDRGVRVEGTAPGMETKVVDEGSVYNIIEGVSKAIEAELKTRGIDKIKEISHEQTAQMADLIGGNPKGLARELLGGKLEVDLTNPGSFGAKMSAAKNLLISEINKLDELTQKGLAERSDAARFEWWRQAQFVGNLERAYLGAKTEMGRTLNAFKIPATSDAAVIGGAYHEIIEGVGGANQIDAAMARYSDLPKGPKRAGYIKGTTLLAKLTDANHEMWINWILSNPWTQVKNVVGTGSIVVANLGEMGVTATRQAPYPLFGRQPDVTFGDMRAHTFGLYMSMDEAFGAAGRGFWNREDPVIGAEMSIYDRNIGQNVKGNARRDPFSAEGFEATNFKRTIDFLGNVATGGRVPIRMLQAGDAFWKTVTYRASLFEQAYRQARLDGKYGEEFSEFVADFVFHPPAAAAKQAADFANYATLQSRMEGWLRNLQKGVGGRVGRILIPFFKTPANGMIYFGEHGPLAPMFKRYRGAIEQGGAQAAQARTRWAVGTGAMVMLAFEYEKGSFTGSLSSDPNIREAYRRMGVTPYSIRVGDEYVMYRDFEPLSTIVGFVADALEVVGHPDMEDSDALQVAIGAALSIGDNLVNKQFMSGLSLFMDAMKSPAGAKRMVDQYRRSYAPMSSGANQVRKWIDPVRRLHAGLKDEYMSRLPGLSDDLPAKRDLWGRPIAETFIVSPYKPNPIDEEIVRLGLRFPMHHGYQIEGVGLKAKEVDIYHKIAGELAFEMLGELLDPETIEGAAYARMKRASETGNKDALDACRLSMRQVLQAAQALAQDEFKKSPDGAALVRNINKRNELIQQEQFMLNDALQQSAQ